MRVALDDILNPKMYKTEVSILDQRHIEGFLKIVLADTNYAIGSFDPVKDPYGIGKCVLVTIELTEDFEATELMTFIKTNMMFIDYLNHYGNRHDFKLQV